MSRDKRPEWAIEKERITLQHLTPDQYAHQEFMREKSYDEQQDAARARFEKEHPPFLPEIATHPILFFIFMPILLPILLWRKAFPPMHIQRLRAEDAAMHAYQVAKKAGVKVYYDSLPTQQELYKSYGNSVDEIYGSDQW